MINAGGDVTLAGSQVKGKRVELDAENLNIESLQDKSSYHGKQMNMQGSVTIGYGFSASAGFSKSKINSEHASVNEQAGIYAGDEGYDVNVKNHTDLKGALITSTQQAESSGLNQFSTGTLSHSDIENHSSYKGSSIGISAKGDAKGGWTGQEKNGISGSVGYGRESDNQDSVTKSGINTQNIEIRNENAQQARTGKSITETLAAIKTDINTDNAESQSGKLENRFDKNALQKELNVQVEATKGFVQTASAAGNAIANKLGEEAVAKQREAQAAQEVADRAYKANPSKENETALNTANQNLITANNEAEKWQTGGEYKRKIDGAMNAISAALGGLPAAGIATSAISPEINHQIKLATEGSPMANKVAHALWGAVEAYSANQNAAAGAGGALAGEVMADVIAKELYSKKPNQLNREEKELVSSVSQAAGALVGGAAANSSQGIGVGLTTAKNAVENNSFTLESVINNPQEAWAAKAEGEAKLIEEKSNIEQSLREEHPIIMQLADGTYAVVSTTGKIIYTIGPIIATPELLAGQITYKVATQVALGLAANTGTQIASGQPFNWYELAGAGMGAVISPRLKSANDVIRVNMGIGMATGLASGSDPIEGAGLAGIGAYAGSKISNPVISAVASEAVQKIPVMINKFSNGNLEQKEK